MTAKTQDHLTHYLTPSELRTLLTGGVSVVDGVQAYHEKEEQILLEVAMQGKVFEWIANGQSILILPPTIALQLIYAEKDKQERLDIQNPRNSPGEQIDQVREGLIALRGTFKREGRMLAVLISRDVAFHLINKLEEPERNLRLQFQLAAEFAEQLAKKGLKVSMKVANDGGTTIDVYPKQNPAAPLEPSH